MIVSPDPVTSSWPSVEVRGTDSDVLRVQASDYMKKRPGVKP